MRKSLAQALFLAVGFAIFASGCVVEPREGYYDRDQHRWYHEHGWHDCDRDDARCR